MAGLVAFNFPPFRRAIDAVIDARMRLAGERMVARSRQLVPVRSGALRESIGYIYRQSDKSLQLYADAPYAIFVEFGTYFMPARPYLRPAIAEASRVWGGSVELAFDTAPQLKSELAQPKTARHREIMAHNRAVGNHYNRGRFGQAKMHIGRVSRGKHRPHSGNAI